MNLDSAVFYTNDIDRAVEFYRDILDCTLEYQNGKQYASFIFLNNARVGIKSKTHEREVPGAQTVILAVDAGIEHLYQSLLQKHVVVYKELSDQEWGKNFSILDTDRNKVEFVQRPMN